MGGDVAITSGGTGYRRSGMFDDGNEPRSGEARGPDRL